MTEQERFQRAFAPLHAPSDTLTEVMKMTEQTHRKSGRRTAVIALAAALLLATGSAAYAADLGSIQRRVQLWLHGDQTDAVMTVEPGHYTLEYTDENGETKPLARNRIRLTVEGGELLAFGSACPYYPESYQSNETDTYYGEALAIIRPQAGAGKVVVKAESELGNAETEIEILD